MTDLVSRHELHLISSSSERWLPGSLNTKEAMEGFFVAFPFAKCFLKYVACYGDGGFECEVSITRGGVVVCFA